MKRRTSEEIQAMALESAKRDLARLQESGLPITPELIRSMARKAAEELAAADKAESDVSMTSQQDEPKKSRWKLW